MKISFVFKYKINDENTKLIYLSKKKDKSSRT